ncbi:MAG: FAD-binding oxidoreductase, partial [Bacteroidetes bacterium]|nr:FAD-binding oxidoreductase [Bacteroidota bacterium]
MIKRLAGLGKKIEGDLFTDETTRVLYATDASAYREIPLAVARPRSVSDIKELIGFAHDNSVALVPRTAGTSLAGQVVGNGIVVDVSRYMTRILELNTEERWVRVEPGVVLDELNNCLEPNGLFFGPETSTSNRCMIGGMVGNNSCGSHSLLYGSTRDHTIAVKAVLSDGSEVEFSSLTVSEFNSKCKGNSLENKLYRNIREILSDETNQEEIRREFPDPAIKRRNTGYAIDILLDTEPFSRVPSKFNFCKLLAGSEGTLAFITEIKLNLVPLPPREKGLMCIHCLTLNEAFHGNLIVLRHNPGAVELMDKVIIDCTKGNIEQRKNRFFIEGDPEAILIAEFARESREEIMTLAQSLEDDLRASGIGYAYPLILGNDIKRVWNLRKAGLGLLSNIPGDAKPVPVVEDTAVNVEFLPDYMQEFREMLDQYDLSCVYYAHIGTGELHLRPVLNLKKEKDIELFHTIAFETARLVKTYNGSLSGEHGDGRLRGEFIPLMICEKNYDLLKQIKKTWDPHNIFNPGKITDTPKMNTFLRYQPGQVTKDIDTVFDFSGTHGMVRAAENCSGSGDCRKSVLIGGLMCPSYMATHEESATTRARANMMREVLTRSEKDNPFDNRELFDILDLCLMCKGCKSECPSSVDMAKLKSEFLYQWYKTHRAPFRTKLIAGLPGHNKKLQPYAGIYNIIVKAPVSSSIVKAISGFSQKRSIPALARMTLTQWVKNHKQEMKPEEMRGRLYLFVDEFTEYQEPEIGIKAIKILKQLGYKVELTDHLESGRTYISKGRLTKAKEIANDNVMNLAGIIRANIPLVGIEPSAILTFRDEYPELVDEDIRKDAREL